MRGAGYFWFLVCWVGFFCFECFVTLVKISGPWRGSEELWFLLRMVLPTCSVSSLGIGRGPAVLGQTALPLLVQPPCSQETLYLIKSSFHTPK